MNATGVRLYGLSRTQGTTVSRAKQPSVERQIAKLVEQSKQSGLGMNPETPLQNAIRLALGQDPDVCLWRNSTGAAQTYDAERAKIGFLSYGLCVGSSDLIGLVRIRSQLPIVTIGGETYPSFGRFIALEVKTEIGQSSKEQRRFLALVRSFGGFGAVVRSVEDARAAVARAKEGKYE